MTVGTVEKINKFDSNLIFHTLWNSPRYYNFSNMEVVFDDRNNQVKLEKSSFY